VALELPQSTRVFEKFKIDYCCGGDQPLAAACASAGVDVQNMLELIEQVKQTPAAERHRELQKATATELSRAHPRQASRLHERTRWRGSNRWQTKLSARMARNHSELLALRDLMRQLFEDLRPHMFKEEQILFPFIITLEKAHQENRPAPFPPFGTVNNPIRMMLMEHDTAGELLREIRKLSSDYAVPADACISFKLFTKRWKRSSRICINISTWKTICLVPRKRLHWRRAL
jgi:regulator of cell morphogenesis and NO signaling